MSADKDIDSSAKPKKSSKPEKSNHDGSDGEFISIFEQERDDPLKPKKLDLSDDSDTSKDKQARNKSFDGKDARPDMSQAFSASSKVVSLQDGHNNVSQPLSNNSHAGLAQTGMSSSVSVTATPQYTAASQSQGLSHAPPGSAIYPPASTPARYTPGQSIQPQQQAAAPLPPSPSGYGRPGLSVQKPQGSWPAQPHYGVQQNPGVQALRGYPAQQTQTTGQRGLLPQNPYAFLNEQVLPAADSKRKGLVWTAVFSFLFLLIVAGVATLIIFGDEIDNSGQNNIVQNDEPAAASLNFQMVEPQHKDEIVTGSVSQQIMGSDGAVIMVTGLDRDYSAEGTAPSPGGKELVKVDLLLGNADGSGPKLFESSSFVMASVSGKIVFPVEDANVGAQLVTLNSGMKGKMSIVYELEPEMSSLVLLYNRTYQESGIRYTMFTAVGLSAATASITSDDVMRVLQAQNTTNQ